MEPLPPPAGREARERSQLITWMLPAGARGDKGWDFPRAAELKGVSAPKSCTPRGEKSAEGPVGPSLTLSPQAGRL